MDEVTVTDADREAAANYMAAVCVLKGEYDPISMAFMDEICDGLPIVQAFARHREQSIAPYREALVIAMAAIDDHNQHRMLPRSARIEEFHMPVPAGSKIASLSDARALLARTTLQQGDK